MFAVYLPAFHQAPAPSSSESIKLKVPVPTISISPPASATRLPTPALKFDFSIVRFEFCDEITPPAIPISPLLESIVKLEFFMLNVPPRDLKNPPVLNPGTTVAVTLLISAVTCSLVCMQTPCVPASPKLL